MSTAKNILIAGGGVAGPALALLLSRIGHKCTIVERAPQFRVTGQQIDLADNGLHIARFMGIEEAVRARTVHDSGIRFVDENGEVIAEFPVGSTVKAAEWVKEIEILRSDLALILYERTKDNVDYVFGDYIVALQQDESGVDVSFANSPSKRYDFVIAADGLRSRTRDLAFDSTNIQIVSLNQFVTFFDIPWKESDETWSKPYNTVDGKCVVLRPRKEHGRSGAYLCQITEESGKIAKMPVEQQIQEVEARFRDAGWEANRILDYLKDVNHEDEFYMQEIAQAKSTSLANGRVALLGDAGYAPSPVSGQGTTLAFTGAYILAGCIATYEGSEALAQYNKQVRPFVDSSQKLPPGIPWIVHPRTKRGIAIRNGLIWLAGLAVRSGITTVLGKGGELVSKFLPEGLKLPNYPALEPQRTADTEK